ncbi:hypothetical protein [Oryzibacter oryziterrae]|uniref:hypothetical protein n=1 Tax=Oryzibacter oryziterrae TaxID=2766474 RepID=UPI001F421A92|nr:hypothetical protein [Oryzibacter oryziterrae]
MAHLPGANRRVEFSTFRHTPTHLARWARATFDADVSGVRAFRLSTCGGVRIWVDGVEEVRFEPFQRNVESSLDIALPLKAGANEVVVFMEEMAERDTNWFFELVLTGGAPFDVFLPIVSDRRVMADLQALAASVRPAEDVFTLKAAELLFETGPSVPVDVEVVVRSHGHDRAALLKRKLVLAPGARSLAFAEPGSVADGYHGLELTFSAGGLDVARAIDAGFLSSLVPEREGGTLAERKATAQIFMADHGAPRAGRLLAMLETGRIDAVAFEDILTDTLAAINSREDCSDFVMVPLLWLWRAHAERLSPADADRTRSAILGYRYWVDEPGNDAMWFWSENHVLCFHVSQYLAGRFLPDETFSCSGRLGAEQSDLARVRLHRWFDAVEAHGFVEWNSAAYYPIDFIGLLAVAEWAEPDLAGRATRLLDGLFRMIALHTLGGVPAGSQGRAYDKELRAGPLTELAPFARVAFGTGWLNNGVAALPMFCAGAYVPPEDALAFADLEPGRAVEARYVQGLDHFARLVVYKTAAAQLSTVVDHGTGTRGHQQHVMDIRLVGHPMARLWVNHPGEDDPFGTQRPSYWAGNGILPRAAQCLDVTLLVFDVAGARVPWTHAYFGRDGLDEIRLQDGWLFVRSADGYGALHAANGLTEVTEGPMAGRELRSPGMVNGWVAVVGDGRTPADFDAFIREVSAATVTFDADRRRLTLRNTAGHTLCLDHADGLSVDGEPRPFVHFDPAPAVTYDSARTVATTRRPMFSRTRKDLP